MHLINTSKGGKPNIVFHSNFPNADSKTEGLTKNEGEGVERDKIFMVLES